MVIRFLCPNGHKIHCPQDRAGKPAKCPKCGVRFLVPELADLQKPGFAGVEAEDPPQPEGPSGLAKGYATQSDQIEFLCPNNHPVHGPTSLQGMPGQCPECGVMFRIPSDEEGDEPAEAQIVEEEVGKGELGEKVAEIQIDPTESPASEGVVLVPADEAVPVIDIDERADSSGKSSGAMPPSLVGLSLGVSADDSGQLQLASAMHPLAGLFAQLWSKPEQRARIELHFSDGQTLVPSRFAPAISKGSTGFFSKEEDDGTHTLVAVSWESVARLVVHGLKELPQELRD